MTLDELLYDDAKTHEGWAITDLGSADWAMAMVGKATGRIEGRKRLADELRARLEARLEHHFGQADKTDQNSIDFFSAELKRWAVLAIMEQGKRKTLSLPSGDIQARNQPDRIEVVDESAALNFLQANHPDAVRVKTTVEIDKAAVKKLFSDGIAVPGCDLMPGAVKYSIVPEVQLVKPPEDNHARIDV